MRDNIIEMQNVYKCKTSVVFFTPTLENIIYYALGSS